MNPEDSKTFIKWKTVHKIPRIPSYKNMLKVKKWAATFSICYRYSAFESKNALVPSRAQQSPGISSLGKYWDGHAPVSDLFCLARGMRNENGLPAAASKTDPQDGNLKQCIYSRNHVRALNFCSFFPSYWKKTKFPLNNLKINNQIIIESPKFQHAELYFVPAPSGFQWELMCGQERLVPEGMLNTFQLYWFTICFNFVTGFL